MLVPANPEHVTDRHTVINAAQRFVSMLLLESNDVEEDELVSLKFDKDGLIFLASMVTHLVFWSGNEAKN